MKKRYMKKQITEATDDITPQSLDEIYGKSIYDSLTIPFMTNFKKGKYYGKPENCYPDSYDTEDVPVKNLIKKDEFYELLVTKLLGKEVQMEYDLPNTYELEHAIELATNQIYDEEMERYEEETKYDEYERSRNNRSLRDDFYESSKKQYTKKQITEAIAYWNCTLTESQEDDISRKFIDEFNKLDNDTQEVMMNILFMSIDGNEFNEFMNSLMSNQRWAYRKQIARALSLAGKAANSLN